MIKQTSLFDNPTPDIEFDTSTPSPLLAEDDKAVVAVEPMTKEERSHYFERGRVIFSNMVTEHQEKARLVSYVNKINSSNLREVFFIDINAETGEYKEQSFPFPVGSELCFYKHNKDAETLDFLIVHRQEANHFVMTELLADFSTKSSLYGLAWFAGHIDEDTQEPCQSMTTNFSTGQAFEAIGKMASFGTKNRTKRATVGKILDQHLKAINGLIRTPTGYAVGPISSLVKPQQ